MKPELDWIAKNWNFLKVRNVRTFNQTRLLNMLRIGDVPTTGKFYGRMEFLQNYSSYTSTGFNGSKKLLLRPFIDAPMPEPDIWAVYIDPKKYVFSEDGKITGLASCYESPVVVFKIDI